MDLLEAIKKDVRITEYAQEHGYTLLRAGSQFALKEHDSVRIDPEKNLFIRNADRQTAGSIIDFVMWIQDMDQGQAIRHLRSMLQYGPDYTPRPRQIQPRANTRKALELPQPTTGKYSRVFAYLNKTRCIDNSIISEMMRRKLLYEDERHNCVFVGFDYDGAPGLATKRSTATGSSYRGDAVGSRKEVGFFVDNHAPALFVTEAPIDALSIMGMLQSNGIDPMRYSYLALCGVSEKALLYHISKPENQSIQKVYLATDNDQAGNEARTQLRGCLQKLGFKGGIIDKAPTKKDWNEDLIALKQPGMQPPRAKKMALPPASEQLTLERGMYL